MVSKRIQRFLLQTFACSVLLLLWSSGIAFQSLPKDTVDLPDLGCQDGQKLGLEVRRSLIPGAGKGLFVTRDVAMGQHLCDYRGSILNGREATLALQSGNVSRIAYLMRLGKGVSIDAFPHPCVLARYINDHPDHLCLNARFVKDASTFRARIVTTRPLQAGQEVYVPYGSGAWTRLAQFGLKRQRPSKG
eukprot:TRINITY_DN81302_c0_g1_i1.p1 TRINITY_DN81302_c0_g1~~TRINITY_DN81302_c0_g1_i1.p1  ORF type:complete len:190 (+),score=5.46 TRINITY_DN81302_c0_g1_i1:95-664(+)